MQICQEQLEFMSNRILLDCLAHGDESDYVVSCECIRMMYLWLCVRRRKLKKQTILPKTLVCLFIRLYQKHFLGPLRISMVHETHLENLF